MKKFNKVLDILGYIFIFIAAFLTIMTISIKKDSNEAITLGGYQLMVVETESMEKNDLVDVSDYDIKSIKKDSLVVVRVVPKDNPYEFYDDIEENDVLTFKYEIANRQKIITHRVIDIEEKEGGFVFYLRGDNINEDGTTSVQIIDTTEEDSFNYVIGKVVSVNYPVGLVLSSLKSKVGIIFVIIVPCLLLIGMEIVKIYNELNKDKKQKQKEKEIELENKNQELEELKKKLLELENEKKSEPIENKNEEVAENEENEGNEHQSQTKED